MSRIGIEKIEGRRRKGEGRKQENSFCFFAFRPSIFYLRRIVDRVGFTLLEIMVTVSILSFGIVALYPAFFMSADTARYADDQLIAQMWAEKKLWEEEDAYHRLQDAALSSETGFFEEGARSFRWEKAVQPVDTGLAALTLTVSWASSAGPRSLAFGTYLNS